MDETGIRNASTDLTRAVTEAVAKHADEPGNLLLVLQEVQARVGCVSPEAIGEVALALNLSRAEVHGVRTFYHDFREAPAGRHVVKVCRAESCQACGADR